MPFLIDAQAVIGKNPVIYYSIPARMFQGSSTKGETKAEFFLARDVYRECFFGHHQIYFSRINLVFVKWIFLMPQVYH